MGTQLYLDCINVHFNESDPTVLGTELLEVRRDHAARSTPSGGKVNNYLQWIVLVSMYLLHRQTLCIRTALSPAFWCTAAQSSLLLMVMTFPSPICTNLEAHSPTLAMLTSWVTEKYRSYTSAKRHTAETLSLCRRRKHLTKYRKSINFEAF